ncbi:hypothetical protein C8R46DRAFT_521477 [Mycena filopes]|nr:hypothetical protein C8R46DRAFT_521477 [Mycena filopes]
MSFRKAIQMTHSVRRFSAQSIHTSPYFAPILSTLNPLSLQPSDYFDLSGYSYRSISFTHTLEGTKPTIRYLPHDTRAAVPFPAQSAGFLYFHRERDAAPLEGSLRFRIAENKLPSSFEAGQDLLLPTGSPWQLILPQVLSARARLRPLGEQLLRENLITTTQISLCRKVFGTRSWFGLAPQFTLFRLSQEFPVDFHTRPTVTTVAESLRKALMRFFSFQTTSPRKDILPFTGSGLARFEPAVVDGRRCVHLRITKIITPAVCSNPENLGRIAEPKEGELLTVIPRNAPPRPWRLNLERDDSAPAAALLALWPTTKMS